MTEDKTLGQERAYLEARRRALMMELAALNALLGYDTQVRAWCPQCRRNYTARSGALLEVKDAA